MNSKFKIVDRVKDGISILQMNVGIMKSVFEEQGAFKWGLIFLAIPVVVNSLFAAMSFPSGVGAIFSKFVFWPISVPYLALAGSFFLLSLFVEQNYKIKLEWRKLFGLLGRASIVFWLTTLVFMFDAVGLMDISGLFNLIWLGGVGFVFFVAYNFLVKVKGMSHKDAVIAVAVGVFSLFLIQILLGKIFVGSYYRVFY